MRRDHEARLSAALDQLYLQGFTPILRQDLYLWYNADRLSKSVYRDITDRWKVICEGYGHEEEEIPDLEELQNDTTTWLLLYRKDFDGEKRAPLAARTE